MTPTQVYEDQVRMQKEADQKRKSEKNETGEDQKERVERENKRVDSTIERKIKKNRGKTNFNAKASGIKRAMILNQPMVVLMSK